MNFVYSSGELYSEICGISLTSLFENNKDAEEINVFIIDNDIGELNKNRFLELAEKYSRKITFVKRPNIEQLVDADIYTGRWDIATFFRLYLSVLLPKNIDRVIYIDCDMIIRHSLKEVYNLDLGECFVAGCDDCRSDLYRLDIGEKPGQLYINNGFMVIDLKKWRENRIDKKFTKFISDRDGDCTYMDQAPLNGVLGSQNLIYELEPKYNAQRIFFDFSYKQLLKLRKPEKHLSEEQYKVATSDPVVVHFTPTFLTGTRPWQKKDKHKFTSEYLYYKSISPWKDEPLRKDDRKFAKKTMTVICKITPKFIMIPVMSSLHAKWYPKKRIKIYEKIKASKDATK